MNNLPEVIQAIIQLIGIPATTALVKARGGRRILIPSIGATSGQSFDALVDIVGQDAIAALISRYDGEVIYIAKCQAAIKAKTWADIQKDYDTGDFSQDDLAEKYDLSYRQISNILKKPTQSAIMQADSAAPQLSLFSQ